jgi:hypothetical protein
VDQHSSARSETAAHCLWLAEGLSDPEVAERFERALPPDVRERCHERIAELRAGGM